MDVLSDVLSWLRVEGTLSRRSEFSAPWGIRYAEVSYFSFLIVEKGRCSMLLDGEHAAELGTGDLVMFSPGIQIALVDEPSTPTVPYARVLEECTLVDEDKYALERDLYPTLEYGGGGRQTAVRGWGLRFEGYEEHPVLSLLPPFVHITYEQRSAKPWLETTLRLLMHETHQRREGSDMMVVRLVDLLFVQLIRAWLQELPDEEAGWLRALRDSSIHHALQLVHQFPADPWTVESLARAVGMSRSSFSARFQSAVGSSPLRYLTQLRMRLAAHALRAEPSARLAEIASRVGYDTESSFGRAFKRYFRVSPGAFRKERGRQSSGPYLNS